MNKAVEGAEIRYTLDGTEPTEHSLLYIGPFETDAQLINACCFYLGEKSNVTHSTVQTIESATGNEPPEPSTF